MRKGIKYKASILLLAWFVIFAHSIIPHNHLDDNLTGCHDLVHQTNPDDHDTDLTIKFKNEPVIVSVCHISGFLFQQFNHDHLIFQSLRDMNFCPGYFFEKLPAQQRLLYLQDHYIGSVSFRAPPAA